MWNNFKQLIQQISIFNEAEFELARNYFKEKTLKKGDFFIKEGQVCRQLAYVYTGLLRSFYINEKGEEITYCFCTSNDIETSFKSFLQSTPSFISIQALEPVSLLVIEKENLADLFGKSIFWSNLGRTLTEKEYLKMELHASESKTENARYKYEKLMKERPDLLQKVPLHYISSYLGISNRHLTRLRKEIM